MMTRCSRSIAASIVILLAMTASGRPPTTSPSRPRPSTRSAALEAPKRLIDPPFILGVSIAGPMRSDWISLNRWYILGPLPSSRDPAYKPEWEAAWPPGRAVDLDGVYVGKANRPARWKYRVIGSDFLEKGLRVEPFTVDNAPHAIWFFYAEVHSDADRRVVASFACDDHGTAWINGQKVYTSPSDPQRWAPFTVDSFRVVELKQGLNTVLFRLENLLGTTAQSVILMTKEDQDLIKALAPGSPPSP